VRMGHALSQGEITPSRYAAGRHIFVSRRGLDKGPIDEALKPFGLERDIAAIVGGFSTALALATFPLKIQKAASITISATADGAPAARSWGLGLRLD